MISEKMGLAKGEISEKDLGNPPHEDDAPAPKKEDAPHHGIPQPEKNPGEKEAGRERHEKESKGHTEVEEEHKRGIYDSPSGGALQDPLIRQPDRSPGDNSPSSIPGIDNKGIFGTGTLHKAYTFSGVSTSTAAGIPNARYFGVLQDKFEKVSGKQKHEDTAKSNYIPNLDAQKFKNPEP